MTKEDKVHDALGCITKAMFDNIDPEMKHYIQEELDENDEDYDYVVNALECSPYSDFMMEPEDGRFMLLVEMTLEAAQ